ncbi:MAG: hypothetical protein LRY50_11315, partial [Geovibrio sp.]|nr:hypothetical protein [Geovibrio sp.]
MRREEILDLLFAQPFEVVCERAARVLEEEKGAHVHVRGLIEFFKIRAGATAATAVCAARTAICGGTRLPRRRSWQPPRAPLPWVQTPLCCNRGEYAIDPMWLADVIDCLRGGLNVPVTLSVGEHPRAAYALWKEAGAVRFLLKHETADPLLYEALHPGHVLAERIASLRVLQRLGY